MRAGFAQQSAMISFGQRRQRVGIKPSASKVPAASALEGPVFDPRCRIIRIGARIGPDGGFAAPAAS
jgi:hypothetical protein